MTWEDSIISTVGTRYGPVVVTAFVAPLATSNISLLGMISPSSSPIVAKIEQVSSTAIVTYSGFGGVLPALGYGVLVDTDDKIDPNFAMVTAEEWLTLLMLGGMGLVGFFALTRSLQFIPPITVAVLRAMEIVLAYGVQAVLGEVSNGLAIAGSSLVITSVVAFAAENIFMTCAAGRFCGIH